MLVMTSPKKGAVVTRAATVDYTLDGGERWWRARGARNVVGLDFVDSVTGWAITAGWSSARGPVYGMLLGTRDDGKAWSALPIPSEGALVTVDFTDATTGYGVTSSGPSRAGGCRLGYYLVRGYQHGPLLHHRRRDRLVHRSCFTQLRRYPGVEHTRFRQLGRRMGPCALAHSGTRPTEAIFGCRRFTDMMARAAVKLGAIATVSMTLILAAGTSSATSPTTAQFQPERVVLASTRGEVFVLGFKSCGTVSCPELWVGTGTSFVQRVAPPGTTPRYMSQLVFANGLDGYTFNTKLGDYATTNGGINWTHVSFGRDVSLSDVVTSDGWYYGVTEHCVVPKGKDWTCNDYRLARSRVGSVAWSSISIPGTGQLTWQRLGLTAWVAR